VLLRTVRCVNGEVQLVLDCEPVFDYGRKHVSWEYTAPGYHQGAARAEGVQRGLRRRQAEAKIRREQRLLRKQALAGAGQKRPR